MTTGTTNFSGAGEWAFNFENAITGNGNDSIIGTVGANSIRTNGGNDAVNALAGNDRIAGGLGNDRLAGGVGNDAFVFDTLANTLTNTDFLTDFFSPADTIFLENAVYAALPAGALAAAAFRIGAVALDPTDRIIYNPATGDIFYDPNGIGGAAQTRFAHVNPGTPVNFTDFFVT